MKYTQGEFSLHTKSANNNIIFHLLLFLLLLLFRPFSHTKLATRCYRSELDTARLPVSFLSFQSSSPFKYHYDRHPQTEEMS